MTRRNIIALGGAAIVALVGVVWMLSRSADRGDYSHDRAAQVMAADLESKLESYRERNGFYPSAEQGLAALVTFPQSSPVPQNWIQQYAQQPLDPWGRAFVYRVQAKSPKPVEVFSLGRDGIESSDDIHVSR
jgi:general secretion pathway protein G